MKMKITFTAVMLKTSVARVYVDELLKPQASLDVVRTPNTSGGKGFISYTE